MENLLGDGKTCLFDVSKTNPQRPIPHLASMGGGGGGVGGDRERERENLLSEEKARFLCKTNHNPLLTAPQPTPTPPPPHPRSDRVPSNVGHIGCNTESRTPHPPTHPPTSRTHGTLPRHSALSRSNEGIEEHSQPFDDQSLGWSCLREIKGDSTRYSLSLAEERVDLSTAVCVFFQLQLPFPFFPSRAGAASFSLFRV